MFNLDWAKRTHKGLRKWILLIVRDQPRNGVEIMDVMEANAQGWWRPSPGSIYPMLDSLVTEGLLKRSEDKRYSLTSRGREEIERPLAWIGDAGSSPRSPKEVVGLISSYVSYLEDLAGSDKSKLSETTSQIRELSNRLQKLGAPS
ncbi:MAG: PadR family transcriptional regulator [Thaumarchaeota archaeon]|nr:PadR family transcriptional regulator [Nitrososphaerota archaeon]